MTRFLLLITLCVSYIGHTQELKSPSEFLGYSLGSQFTRHHKVVDYFQYLAQAESERMQLIEYGQTNEGRPLLLTYFSSKENIKNIEAIRKEHLESTSGTSTSKKVIVWLSYNVHGNESVSTEAAMQTIYDLLTKKSEYLENTVVIMDPCSNPDGRDRYVNWFNENKNLLSTADPNSKEHHEGWLNGRPNHYMFDLNRDWAWLTQKESQQRLKMYNKWLPHVHVDFHEQGVDSPYYFATAAEPFHEVITDFQREFQITIGKNHAKYFDKNGWFYFTQEVFDLLYPSYGDTYPMYNGGIGMTYEQGGSGRAGLAIKTAKGDTLTLSERIAHHYTTGISTVEVSSKNTERLNTEFKKFYSKKKFKYKSYVMNGDTDKIEALTKLLDQHNITYGKADNGTLKGFKYDTGKTGSLRVSDKSLVVSTNQTKGTLVKVLFEPNAKLSDSLTYDITAWSLPYAYGLDAIATTSTVSDSPYQIEKATNNSNFNENAYAYLTDWNSMNDARFLAALHQAKIRVRVAHKPYVSDGKKYQHGSLIIARADNKHNKNFISTLKKLAVEHNKSLTATKTGFVDDGKDFGSRYVKLIDDVKIAVLSGGPTSTLRFGEIWHFMEQQLNHPLTVIDAEYFNRINLAAYDVLVLPSGPGYTKLLSQSSLTKLKYWVKNGGKLIAMGESIGALEGKNGFKIKTKKTLKDSIINMSAYGITQRQRISNEITGAIFKTKVDRTHPLAYGYGDSYFTIKLGKTAYEYLDGGSVVYLEAGQNEPVAGFAGYEAKDKIDKSLIFGVEKYGSGNVIYMVDNPLFRGFWENGKLFFANALFMVQ
ncbi:zinc carboxypeptidase [Aurantibacter crassamenti]|uniref:M14 family metallopeptidase n=1 Tax=Aurantibacter crassamenti TaxID=1837375 RepID=UPI001939FCBA|nr:M14 family metallopeptidase [Aurantibacter crassamenti]MBM1107928.1 zinc carboxypeptidase [Aurantibacter crassamenti]